MRARFPFVMMAFLSVAMLFLLPGNIPAAHAQRVGTVCISPLDAATNPLFPTNGTANIVCPAQSRFGGTGNSTGLTFTGPVTSPAHQIIVGVWINNSDRFLGFDITLKASPTVLTPADADLVGTILTSAPLVFNKCIGGIQESTSGFCQPTDTVDTIHFSAGQAGFVAGAGLLFRAVWNITGTNVAGSPISIHYQTGCPPPTSTGANVCITILSGSPSTPTPETFLTSNFDDSNVANIPFVSVSAPVVNFGTVFVGSNLVTETLTYTSHNNFAGSLTLTASAASFLVPNPTCSGSLNVTSITPVANGTVHVGLTITATAAGPCGVTVSGSYQLDATTLNTAFPTGFFPTDSLVVPVAVNANFVDFTIAGSPTVVKFLTTGTGASTITVGSVNSFAGSVALSTFTITPATTPVLSASYSPSSVIVPAGGSNPSTATFGAGVAATTYTVAVRGSSTLSGFTRTKGITLTVVEQDFALAYTGPPIVTFNSGGMNSTTFTVRSLPTTINGLTGVITISTSVNATGLTVNCPASVTLTTGGQTSTAQTCNLSSSTPGSYMVTITGSATASGTTVTHSATFVVTVNGFTVVAAPTTVNVIAGVSGSSTLTIGSKGNFTRAVVLTASSSATGLTCTLTPTSVTPPAGGAVTSTLSCSGSSGVYTVTVSGTSTGFATKTATATFTVQDFTVSASPTSVTVLAGASATSTVTVSGQNGFAGTVTLTSSSSPAAGLTCTLSPPSVTLGSSGTSNLSCTGSSGAYTVTVTGSSSGLVHTATVALTLQDFTIVASPTSVSVDTSTSGTSTLTISAANGFAGAVSLTVSAPSGVTATVSPSSVSGGSGSSTLTVSSPTAGTYTVNVTGTSGTLSHSVAVTVTVTAPSGVFGLPAAVFYSIIGILVVIAALAAVLFLRRRRPKPVQSASR